MDKEKRDYDQRSKENINQKSNLQKVKKKLTVNEELKIQLKKNLLEATDVKNKIFSVSRIIFEKE